MPGIVTELHGFGLYSWVFTGFLLAQAVSIPVFGRMADAYGRKLAFRVGTCLFLLGSTFCGFAPNMGLLIGFRILQGLGAGGVQPVVMTICGDVCTPVERAFVQGLVSMVFGVAALAGPLLGALVIEHGAWPIVFWVGLPFGALSLAGIEILLPDLSGSRDQRIDYAGPLLVLVAVSMLLLSLVEGSRLPNWANGASIAIGIAALPILVWQQVRSTHPMLPFDLLRQPLIGWGCLANCLISAVMMAVTAFLPTYVQDVLSRTALTGGLVLGAMSSTWAVASLVTGRLIRHGHVRRIAIPGALALIVGSLLIAVAKPTWGLGWIAAGALLIGAGMGLCNTVFIVSIQASVTLNQRGAATSSILFARFVGQVLGVAGFGAILNGSLPQDLTRLSTVGSSALNQAVRAERPIASQVQLIEQVATGMHNGFWMTVVLSVAALIAVNLLPRRFARAI
jgi:MFS family permease